MNRVFKSIGFLSLLIFSFYYTSEIAKYVSNKNPVMQEIVDKKGSYKMASKDALINGNTIIPGVYGLEVDINSSFNKMKQAGVFNENFLIYDYVIPSISLIDNKDKVIIKGNPQKKAVSFIIEDNDTIKTYFKINRIKADIFTHQNNFKLDNNFELLNGEVDKNLFDNVNTLLDNKKINKNICIMPYNNELLCKNSKMYLVRPSSTLNNSNIIDIKNNVTSGDIIIISKNSKLSDVVLLLKELKFRDLDVIYLSDLISENS